ncbi:MAG: hypothetical protein KKG09_00665 [Verrucomicrobia bacterium]|nr:hypothetical protein [Verrucomicrobiota bacterium]MCG2678516.1 hypothetical protein [Kiritimatiellia bacterium]MBU4248022.1 hypothetical protein [Verrucomicrobiota bacterium]MBU4289540.1 hypothetical protein [Verrucomicrobiota bacterium]MBU4427761.1 hypothetical protein [Verrucomicrobiota bacterium]
MSGKQRQQNPSLNNDIGYGLRFLILPGKDCLRRTRETAAFCLRHKITGVHLFFNAEEWYRGHPTEPEIRKFLVMFRQIVPIFRQAGLSVGLNPWTTIGHCDRGRALRAGQNFELMVSPSGKRSNISASFACPRFRRYLASLFHRLAAVGFDILWLEDDFRYHNHAPLDWGGDFSPSMLKRFSERIGRLVSREEVVRNVLRPGVPHPWRREWMALWRQCQEELAGLLAEAVKSANPQARLGLMSSHPDTHSAEGRSWSGLFRAMAINGRAVHRPHFASYGEENNYSYSFSLLAIQKDIRPDNVDSYPEIENFPFGRFNKSDRQTFSQMALAKLMGSEGLLLDLHPMTGNSVEEELGIGEMLDKAAPALAWISERFPRAMKPCGAGIPFKEDSASYLHLPPGMKHYDGLECLSDTPGSLLGPLGIAYQMREAPGVNLVFGPKAWTFTDDEITRLLGKGLWLDPEAAVILTERGFGRHLGIRIDGWLEREQSLYAIERFVSRQTGVRQGFHASANKLPRILTFQAKHGTQVWTEIIDCMNRRLGAGLTVFSNILGGAVAISACPLYPDPQRWNLNFQRQILVQNLMRRLARTETPAMTSDAPLMFPMDFSADGIRRIVCVNLHSDPGAVHIWIPNARRIVAAHIIFPLERPRPAKCRSNPVRQGLDVITDVRLPRFGLWIAEVESP